MGKMTINTSQMRKISERVMLATLASSMVMTSMFATTTSALSNNTSSALLQTKEILQSTQSVSILESKGWLESANVEWSAVEGATGYNVYYKS